jgi:TolB-like protein
MTEPSAPTPEVPSAPPPAVRPDPQAPAPKGVLDRLKQHKVAQWTLAYAAAGYTLLHAVEMLSEAQEWPHAIARVLSLVLILGVPIVITLAWYHGARHAHRVSGPELTIITILLVLTGSVLWALTGTSGEHGPLRSAPAVREDGFHSPGPQASAPAGISLAVLPFVDMSPDHNQDYFSDGLSEEVLNQLAQIKELRVVGRTSSFSFKGKNEDLRVIAEKLGVNHLLEGSVRKSDKHLRVTAQLINAADGTHLWSHSYDSELTNVFAVQEEIAMAVAQALSISLDVGEMSRANGGTTNVDAYDKYLQARALAIRATSSKEDEQAVPLFREALALDPSFARAWFELYGALQTALLFGADPVATGKEMSEVVAKLTDLAPESALTQSIRMNRFLLQRKWSEADAAGRAMLASAPTPEIAASYSLFLMDVGRAKEALEYIRREVQREPLSSLASLVLQMTLDQAGRPEEAQAEYQRSKGLAGGVFRGLDGLALMRLWSRKDPDPAAVKAQLGVALAKYGLKTMYGITPDNWNNKPAASAALRHAFEDHANFTEDTNEVFIAVADHYGEKGMALASYRRAFLEQGDIHFNILWFWNESGLRTDPRFKDILRDLGLVDYFRTSGKWPDYCSPVGKDDFQCY